MMPGTSRIAAILLCALAGTRPTNLVVKFHHLCRPKSGYKWWNMAMAVGVPLAPWLAFPKRRFLFGEQLPVQQVALY